MGVKVSKISNAVNWQVILIVGGAVVGTGCGWLMARENGSSYMPVAYGAFIGGIVGYWLSQLID